MITEDMFCKECGIGVGEFDKRPGVFFHPEYGAYGDYCSLTGKDMSLILVEPKKSSGPIEYDQGEVFA